MKNWRVIVFVGMFIGALSSDVKAQDEIDKLLEKSIEDGEYLMKGYLDPFMKSLAQGLNQGWYNTAKPHKVAGFDLTFTTSLMFVPSSDRFSFVDNSKLTAIERISGPNGNAESGNVPTFFGPDSEPTYRDKITGEEFSGPPGVDLKKEIGYNALPVPMAQLGFGLPKGFEVKFRYVPKIDLGSEGEFNMWGVGVMHNVKQYIPGIKLLPFDLSGFVGYTRFKLNVNFDEGEIGGANQQGIFEASATTIQGVISKKISVLTVYGGAGYNIAKSKLAVKGWYDINANGNVDNRENNPINLDFAASGPRVTAGFRLKLAVLTLGADYTLQKYNSLSVGIGISVR